MSNLTCTHPRHHEACPLPCPTCEEECVEDCYVLTVGTRVVGVWSDHVFAKYKAVEKIQALWDAGPGVGRFALPRPTRHTDLERWNQYFAGDTERHVVLHLCCLDYSGFREE